MAKKNKKAPKVPEDFDYISSEKDTSFEKLPLRASKQDWRALLSERREEATYEDLEKIERRAAASTKKKTADTRQRIPISELIVAEQVFQWRGVHSNLQAQDAHMRELVRGLETGEDLQKVTVITLGDKVYLVDGHHRLAAYVALKKKSVPVTHFKGTLHQAWLKSLTANVRDKLPIMREDKFEAAFTLVKHKVHRRLDDLSCEDIAHHTVTSDRLVYKMQKMLREALEAAKGKKDKKEVYEKSWRRLQKKDDEDKDFDAEEFVDTEARKMASAIMASVGRSLVTNPDITARALYMISEHLPRVLIEEWLDVAEDVLLEQAETTGEEVVTAFQNAFKLYRSEQERF